MLLDKLLELFRLGDGFAQKSVRSLTIPRDDGVEEDDGLVVVAKRVECTPFADERHGNFFAQYGVKPFPMGPGGRTPSCTNRRPLAPPVTDVSQMLGAAATTDPSGATI